MAMSSCAPPLKKQKLLPPLVTDDLFGYDNIMLDLMREDIGDFDAKLLSRSGAPLVVRPEHLRQCPLPLTKDIDKRNFANQQKETENNNNPCDNNKTKASKEKTPAHLISRTPFAMYKSELPSSNPLKASYDFCASESFKAACRASGIEDPMFTPKHSVADLSCSSSICKFDDMKNRFLHAVNQCSPEDILAIAFHGTPLEDNVRKILENGLDPALRKIQAYGPGEYFGKSPSHSLRYAGGGACGGKMLVFLVILPGIAVDGNQHQRRQAKRADDRGYIVVENNSHQIPLGVLTFKPRKGIHRRRSPGRRVVTTSTAPSPTIPPTTARCPTNVTTAIMQNTDSEPPPSPGANDDQITTNSAHEGAAPATPSSSTFVGEVVQNPSDEDILGGRGKGSMKTSGQLCFRYLIRLNQATYLVGSDQEKNAISKSIYDAIPGRILKPLQQAKGVLWVEMERKTGLEKIKQALRENAPAMRRYIDQHGGGEVGAKSVVARMLRELGINSST